MVCPECRCECDQKTSREFVVFHSCRAQHGHLISYSHFKRLKGKYEYDRMIHAFHLGQPSKLSCPKCIQPMKQVEILNQNSKIMVDTCATCRLLWFELGELKKHINKIQHDDRIPQTQMSPAYTVKDERDFDLTLEESVAGFLGFPVLEHQSYTGKHTPIICILTSIVCIGFYIIGRQNPVYFADLLINQDGLSLKEITTIVWSNFFHFSGKHLLGNLLFFLVLGPFLESQIGNRRFLEICALSIAAILILEIYLDQKMYSVGLSGVLYGVLVYFSYKYPKTQMVSVFKIRMPGALYNPILHILRIPIWMLTLFYLTFDFISVSSRSGVDHMAHIFGAIGGVLALLIHRDEDTKGAKV